MGKRSLVRRHRVPLLLLAVCLAFWGTVGSLLAAYALNPWKRHFDAPMPESAELDRHHWHWAGIDHSHAFAFTCEDDALLELLIDEWQLERWDGEPAEGVDDWSEPISFVDLDAPTWWPRQRDYSTMSDIYYRVQPEQQLYWSVWYDRRTGKLYAEYGDW